MQGASWRLPQVGGAPCCWWRCRARKLTAVADSVRPFPALAQARARVPHSDLFWRDPGACSKLGGSVLGGGAARKLTAVAGSVL